MEGNVSKVPVFRRASVRAVVLAATTVLLPGVAAADLNEVERARSANESVQVSSSEAPTAEANSDLSEAAQSARRAELGLDARREVVQQLLTEYGSNASVTLDGGVLVTSTELSQVRSLDEAAGKLALALRPWEDAPDFGGMYIDRSTGEVVILVVGAGDGLRQAVAAADVSSVAAVRAANFSYAELQAAATELVTSRNDDLAAEGVTVLSTDVNQRDNTVEVSLAEDSEQARRLVAGAAPSDMFRFVGPSRLDTNGVNRLDAPPLAGGQRITRLGDRAGTLGLCTSAFVGYNSRQVALTTVRDYYLITAGHCGGDSAHPWSQSSDNPAAGSYPVGVPDRNTFSGTTAADAQRVPIRAADAALLIRISTTRSNVVSTQQSASGDVIGERVCMSGATSNNLERCGTLQTKDLAAPAEGVNLVRQRTATFLGLGGDSGGSVYDGSRAKGVYVGNVTYGGGTTSEVVRGVYSHIGEVLPALGVARVS